MQPSDTASAFEMITGTVHRRIEWHELLAAICKFMNHSASDNSRTDSVRPTPSCPSATKINIQKTLYQRHGTCK